MRIIIPRGGLGNRLRFLEGVLTSGTNDKKIIIWCTDRSCHINPLDYFEFTLDNSRLFVLPKYVAPVLYFMLFVMSIINPNKVSLNSRQYIPNVWFESSPHAYEGSGTRFSSIRFSKKSRLLWEGLKLKHRFLLSSYDVCYLRGTDNIGAIEKTDFRKIFTILEQSREVEHPMVGVTDDPIFRNIFSSYDILLLRTMVPRRERADSGEETIEDLLVLAHSKSIFSSAYSSFAELGVRLGQKNNLEVQSNTS